MGILSKNLDISLGPISGYVVAIESMIYKMNIRSLNQTFGIPLRHYLELSDTWVDHDYYHIIIEAREKLQNIFADMTIDVLLSPERLLADLEHDRIAADAVSIHATSTRMLRGNQYRLIFYHRNNGKYIEQFHVNFVDHHLNYEVWNRVLEAWEKYSRNGGQYSNHLHDYYGGRYYATK